MIGGITPSGQRSSRSQRAIRAAHHQAPISCVIDLHAPHHGDTSCYAFGNPAGDLKGAELQTSLIRFLANEGPETVGFRETDLRNDYRPERSAREYLARTLDVPVLTFEISYHLAQSERYLTQSDYRDFGSAIARGLDKTI